MAANYESLDLLELDEFLSEEELLIRSTVRQFVNKKVIPLLQSHHREEKFPLELVKDLASLGLLGCSIQGYGCSGLTPKCYGIAMQELERADSGIRSFCSVQTSLAMWPIFQFGNEEQRKKFLPKMAKGEWIGCFGLTEPNAGSNPNGMQTTAKKTKGGYVLNGNKMWITNGSLADVAVVWAKLDNEVCAFLVEKNFAGFTTTHMKGKFSLRVSVTSELHFDNCFVPEENRLPLANSLKAALSCLSEARFGISWGVVGAANSVYHTALEYAKEREIFDRKMAGFQLVQAKLVKMAQEITKAQMLNLQLANLKEKKKIRPHHISLGKMNNCKMALEAAREARDILGAYGIMDEYPIIRHLMNLETVNTYEGTEDIHRLILGKELTGISAFF